MSSEIDFRQVVDAVGDGIVVCDPKGAISYWNGGCERIFGFSEEDSAFYFNVGTGL